MITYQELKPLIDKGLTQREISIELNCSQTNIKYWLSKYDLSTKRARNGNSNCRICNRETSGTFYCSDQCNRKAQQPAQRQKETNRKIKLIGLLSPKGCAKCSYSNNLAALDFHHVNPSEKSFVLGSREIGGYSWDKILKEAQKCIVLCKNCHMEHHNPRLSGLLRS